MIEPLRTMAGEVDKRHARRAPKLARVFDLLAEPRTLDELCAAVGCSRRTAYLLIRDLGARGILVGRVGTGAETRWARLSGG